MYGKETLSAIDQAVVEASDVEAVRKLILNLGLEGMLTPQDLADPPAMATLGEVSKSILPTSDARPHPNLSGWAQLPLGAALATNVGGGTPSKREAAYWNGAIPWASVKDVQTPKYIDGTQDSITELGLANSSSNLIPPNRLLVVTRMGLGKLAINTIPVAINQDLRAIEPNEALDLDYAYLLFKGLKMEGTGSTVQGITISKLHAMAISLPPLAEQKRIVAKVNELMALCDRLEAKLKQREEIEEQLGRAAVARFEAEPVEASLDAILSLANTPTVDQVEGLLIHLAVRGRLETHDPNDEPIQTALDALATNRANRARQQAVPDSEILVQSRKHAKNPAPLELHELPASWQWSTLIGASIAVVDCHNKTAPYVDAGVRLIRTTNIREGKLNNKDSKFVTETTYQKWSARIAPRPRDLLITREAPMGEVCMIPDGEKICMGQRMMLIRLDESVVRPEFLLYSLRDHRLLERVQDKPKGATVEHLRVGGIETLAVPLPPLVEQDRIVYRLERLLEVISRWRTLSASRSQLKQDILNSLSSEGGVALPPRHAPTRPAAKYGAR